jgi:hypothetical protein
MTTRAAPPAAGGVVEIAAAADALLDDDARQVVQRLGEWANAHAGTFGVRVDGVRARRWQSAEDPEWVQVVVVIGASGETERIRRFWDAAIDHLSALTAGLPAAQSDRLSVEVDWVDPNWT